MTKSKTILSLFAMLLLVAAVGCGSDDNSGGGTGSGTGTGTGSGTGTTTGTGTGATCSSPGLKVGFRAYHRGTQGGTSPFPSASADYIGVVEAVYSNSTAAVTFPAPIGTISQTWAELRPEGSCTPSITDKVVRFTGAQGTTDFPSTTAVYAGKIKTLFARSESEANGWVEVDWDHLSYNTVELINEIALTVP